MATRWAASGVFGWQPILSFTRRRMAVLDWFEENLEPVAFTDDPFHAGIAIDVPEQRLRFDRESLTLETEGQTASVSSLKAPLEGAWAVIEPKDVQMRSYRGAWSLPLESDYEQSRRALTSRVVGSRFGGQVVAFDTAALVDIASAASRTMFKIEFGVVTAEELAGRLANDKTGMLSNYEHGRAAVSVEARDLPEVSAFFDVVARCQTRCKSATETIKRFADTELEVSKLVTTLGADL